jgi:hypothetical protein
MIRKSHYSYHGNAFIVETAHNQYVFSAVTADQIRGGQKKDVEGLYVYTGSTSANNYPAESDLDEVPDEVLEAVEPTIVENVDAGWASWDGRPEFSTSYVDISEATEVAS